MDIATEAERSTYREKISVESKKEITKISGSDPLRFILQAVSAWLVIAAAIYLAIIVDNFLITVLAIILIATRQNVFALLTHEQAHYLGLKGKYADWICNAIASYPLLILSVENYSKVHLAHHHYFFSQQDPDFHRKSGKNWAFPMPKQRFFLLLLKDIAGLSIVGAFKGKNNISMGQQYRRKNPTPKWFKVSYYVLLCAVLTITNTWYYFLIFWLLPLVTVFQAIIRWGAVCEHIYGTEGAKVEDCSPVILNTWVEKLLLPNLNFTLHPYHHYFPAVSYSKLPRVHDIFVKEGLINPTLTFKGYRQYWKYLFRKD